jgi:cathepsin C
MPFFSAVLVLGFINAVTADLPVHCLRHQVAGDWEFTLGPLNSKRSSCGHTKPDNPYQQPHMQFLTSAGATSKRRFSLGNPNTVTDEDGSSGTWTMIYDEGFEVAVGGSVFFAFNKFNFTDADRQHNISHCGETQIGWYHDATRTRWGCYVGRKVGLGAEAVAPAAPAAPLLKATTVLALTSFGSGSSDTSSALSEEKNKKRTEILTSWLDSADQMAMEPDADTSSEGAVSEVQTSSDDEFTSPPEYKPWVPTSAGFDKPMEGTWQKSVATALNFLQLGWTASSYDKFHGRTPRQLNQFAGVRRARHNSPNVQLFPDQDLKTSFLEKTSKVRHSHSEAQEFDWRKKDGKNWLTEVVTQGDCGSCYTISTVHMLTARNRIRVGSTEEPSFSVSFPLYCSEYNQGCDGGYGFLQSKWTEDVGLVPEACSPFSQGGGTCSITPGCDLGSKRYRASGHHYVGGYYGGSDADSIRKELVEKGPVVSSFEPKEDFMYYKSGVYRSAGQKIHEEWQQVDHAVLLVGYGREQSHPYWTMQNSWGSDWGEDGYFRMERGNDESGCESIVVSADVTHDDSNSVLDDFIAAL